MIVVEDDPPVVAAGAGVVVVAAGAGVVAAVVVDIAAATAFDTISVVVKATDVPVLCSATKRGKLVPTSSNSQTSNFRCCPRFNIGVIRLRCRSVVCPMFLSSAVGYFHVFITVFLFL